jgi:hypothetical protein
VSARNAIVSLRWWEGVIAAMNCYGSNWPYGKPYYGQNEGLFYQGYVGSDGLQGTFGDDTIAASMDEGWISASSGDDRIGTFGSGRSVQVYGDEGNDFIFGQYNDGEAEYHGGPGNDSIHFQGSDNTLLTFDMRKGDNSTTIKNSDSNNIAAWLGDGRNLFGTKNSDNNNINFVGTDTEGGSVLASLDGHENTYGGYTGNGSDVIGVSGYATRYDDLTLGRGSDVFSHQGDEASGTVWMDDGEMDIASISGSNNKMQLLTDENDIIALDGKSDDWELSDEDGGNRVFENELLNNKITVTGDGRVYDAQGNEIAGFFD